MNACLGHDTHMARPEASAAHAAIGRAATLALYDELALAPKPGLVSFVDTGSHDDMDAGTFMRSLFTLRHYFVAMAEQGAKSAEFAPMRALGVAAEARMLRATRGVNTHRGAIFTLGLLCAAAGASWAAGQGCRADSVRSALVSRWAGALSIHARASGAVVESHGARAARLHGLRSVATEAALGLPTLFDHVLPALRAARRAGADDRHAHLHALFVAMAEADDTNLVHRGGIEGLHFARQEAREFLASGGGLQSGAVASAGRVHDRFVERRLSPGGAADLLAAACWMERVEALAR